MTLGDFKGKVRGKGKRKIVHVERNCGKGLKAIEKAQPSGQGKGLYRKNGRAGGRERW